MTTTDENAEIGPNDPNQRFYDKAIEALEELFDKAKAAHELHFVMGLMPEFHGAQDGVACTRGWNTADWPAPGSEDTELGVSMEPEVDHGEAEVHTRVQA